MRILITNVYSSKNRGDAGIVYAMIDELLKRDAFRHATISVSSSDYPGDRHRFPVEVVPSFSSLRNVLDNAFLRQLYFLCVLLPSTLLWALAYRFFGKDLPIFKGARQLARIYAKSDLIVGAGGGYLYTTSPLHGNVVLLSTLYSLSFALLLGKPLYLFSQSIGPFSSKAQAYLVKRLLRKAKHVQARDDVTQAWVRTWKKGPPVYRTCDAAFLVQAEEADVTLVPAETAENRVGLTVRRWFRNSKKQEAYEEVMARFVSWICEEKRGVIHFIPQVTYCETGDDDRICARKILSKCDDRLPVQTIENDLSPQQVKGLCGEMDLFVGTRMHSNIYALSAGVPSLAIAYQPKTHEIMRELGLGDLVLDIEDLDLSSLQKAFHELVSSRQQISEQVKTIIPQLQRKAGLGAQLIEEDYLNLSSSCARSPEEC